MNFCFDIIAFAIFPPPFWVYYSILWGGAQYILSNHSRDRRRRSSFFGDVRTSRIVAADRLRLLGSVCSLLCGEKRCENDTQSFSLSFQIRTAAQARVVLIYDRHLQNKNAPNRVRFALARVDKKDDNLKVMKTLVL